MIGLSFLLHEPGALCLPGCFSSFFCIGFPHFKELKILSSPEGFFFFFSLPCKCLTEVSGNHQPARKEQAIECLQGQAFPLQCLC